MYTIDSRDRYVDPYDYARLTAKEIEALDPFDSTFMTVIQALPPVTDYLITDLERRPELISYEIYRTTDLWWPLMIYNGFIDQEEMRSGIVLNCFRRRDVENLIAQLLTVSVIPTGQHYNRNLTRGRLIPAAII